MWLGFELLLCNSLFPFLWLWKKQRQPKKEKRAGITDPAWFDLSISVVVSNPVYVVYNNYGDSNEPQLIKTLKLL